MLLENATHASKDSAMKARPVAIFANLVLITMRIPQLNLITLEQPALITCTLQLVQLGLKIVSQSHHVRQQTTLTSLASVTLRTREPPRLPRALVAQEEHLLLIPSKTNANIVYQGSIQLQKVARRALVDNSQKTSLATTVHLVHMPRNGSITHHGKICRTTSRRYATMSNSQNEILEVSGWTMELVWSRRSPKILQTQCSRASSISRVRIPSCPLKQPLV